LTINYYNYREASLVREKNVQRAEKKI